MLACPTCGQENPDGARFCNACAASLAPEATPPREERKVITCLFCDLVGFTSRAERMDPEEVRGLLQPYHARVRGELERRGGSVEKFIGDAVVAVFGAPAAHDDDPERAVRAALAVRDSIREEGSELHVRVGITTGEALVALSVRPAEGEGMASGDVVNTAARIQAAAPEDGILVDETTHRATERVIAYRGHASVEAKGKSEPVPVWEALEAKARFGVDVRQIGRSPLVGRQDELDALMGALARARRERQLQLVTLVGVPGIGKSRLVWELFQRVDAEPEPTLWRQGRSLPYGDGVSFWALGEMVKAQAGVLETDDASRTQVKLRETVAALVADPADAGWLERHLHPLVGLESESPLGADRRGEAFAAWRRFFEALAEQHPLVLVFEDLHFADDGLLDFVDHLVDWVSGVPILVVGTARPELLSRRPAWGGGKPNALTLSLSSLSDEETAWLVHSLLEKPVLDAALQTTLLERAGGNPLYAEEFVRMLEERGVPEELPLPETVQGLIAARIDALGPEEKALLQDTAVIGKVFWLGAAAALGGLERWAAEDRLHSLERKEFVRRERRSSVASEVEYVFRHLLVRDVAYGQIPRAARAEKHRLAAEWIRSLGRPEDHAEMLAHHYLSALELLRDAGQPITQIAEPARLALREAGDRALALNVSAVAARYYSEALGLWPADDPELAEVLFRLARARFRSGHELGEESLEEAREALLRIGDREQAAEADALLAELWWNRGERDRCDFHLERASGLIQDLPASPAKAHVLSQVSRYQALAGDDEDAIRIGREALAMAEELGLDELRAHALNNVAIAKSNRGDIACLADLERAAEIARVARSGQYARSLHNLGVLTYSFGDLRQGLAILDEAMRADEEIGYWPGARYSRGTRIFFSFGQGDWEEHLKEAEGFIAEIEAGQPNAAEEGVRRRRARVRLARGDVDGALEDIHRSLELVRQVKDLQTLIPSLSNAARCLVEAGRTEEARPLASELLQLPAFSDWALADLAWVAEELGCVDELRRALENLPGQTPFTRTSLALLDHDYEAGADLFDEIGELDNEALARLRAAGKLLRDGRRSEADEQLQKALAFFRSVGATPYIAEAEALLAASTEPGRSASTEG